MERPEIYKNTMNPLEFLNETETAFLGCGSAPMKKMLKQRMELFSKLHLSWQEYNPKTGAIRRLGRIEWKKKAYRIMNLNFSLTNEQAKGVMDLYLQRVNVPKGGLARED